jgi:hypothetical protein
MVDDQLAIGIYYLLGLWPFLWACSIKELLFYKGKYRSYEVCRDNGGERDK